MSFLSRIESFFKPEVRKAGEDLVGDESFILSSVSDTAVRGSGRGLNPARVNLASASVAAASFTVSCTCTSGKRGALCKHVWAAIVLTARQHPDFLDSKTEVHVAEARAAASPIRPAISEQHAQRQAELKEKQSADRKERYQRMKARAKELKGGKSAARSAKSAPVVDPDVQEALAYFEQNGFTFEIPVDEGALGDARKQLARIFHPDKGGTHEESVELNRHYDVLASLG